MKITLYNNEGELWEGKMPAVPRVGDSVTVNNKNHYGTYDVIHVVWFVDQSKVSIRVSDGSK